MTTRPPRPGRRRRPVRAPGGPADLLWATVLRRFRDHVHRDDPETRPDTHPDPDTRPDPEGRR
jgi:hypothetical protein